MSNELKRAIAVKKKVDRAAAAHDKASGALSHIRKRMKKEFEVSNITDAQNLLTKMEKEEKRLRKKLDKQMQRFEKKWGDALS